jgi:hypothetical protein
VGFGAVRTLDITAAKPSGFAAPKTLVLAVATFRSCGCTIFARDKARLPGVRRRGFVTAGVLTAGFLPGGLGFTFRLSAQASLSVAGMPNMSASNIGYVFFMSFNAPVGATVPISHGRAALGRANDSRVQAIEAFKKRAPFHG